MAQFFLEGSGWISYLGLLHLVGDSLNCWHNMFFRNFWWTFWRFAMWPNGWATLPPPEKEYIFKERLFSKSQKTIWLRERKSYENDKCSMFSNSFWKASGKMILQTATNGLRWWVMWPNGWATSASTRKGVHLKKTSKGCFQNLKNTILAKKGISYENGKCLFFYSSFWKVSRKMILETVTSKDIIACSSFSYDRF